MSNAALDSFKLKIEKFRAERPHKKTPFPKYLLKIATIVDATIHSRPSIHVEISQRFNLGQDEIFARIAKIWDDWIPKCSLQP